IHRLRREPPWPDQPRPGGPRPRADPRPGLRARRRPGRPRQGRASPPAGAHVPGARRGEAAGCAPRRGADFGSRPEDRPRTERGRVRSFPSLGAAPTPSRPGPGAMPTAFLRALELSIGRRMEGLLAGDYRSILLGDGTGLAQAPPYVPG